MKKIPLIIIGLILIFIGLITISIWPKNYFWIERENAKMPVWVKGNIDSGVFIIFIHGGPGSSGTLESIIEVAPANGNLDHKSPINEFEKNYAVVYWDQRHAGMSKGKVDPNKSKMDDFGKDLALVIDELKQRFEINSLFIMGQSFGHAVAVDYLTSQENWFENQLKITGYINYKGNHEQDMAYRVAREKVLLFAKNRISENNEIEYWQKAVSFYTPREKMTEISDIMYHSMYVETMMDSSISLSERILSSVKASILSPFNGLRYYPNNKKTTEADAFMEQIVFDRSLSTTINRLKLPTLLLYGQHDLIAPVEVGDFIYEEIGTEKNDKKLVILSESRHGAEGSDIEIFQQEVTSFIEKYRTGSD